MAQPPRREPTLTPESLDRALDGPRYRSTADIEEGKRLRKLRREPVDVEYAGFWIRLIATIIDIVLILSVTTPILYWIYGPTSLLTIAPVKGIGGGIVYAPTYTPEPMLRGVAEFIISWVLPMLATTLLWVQLQATPGKLAIKARVVDARSGHPIHIGQALLRYFGYFLSAFPMGVGFVWAAFDPIDSALK